MRNLCIFVGLLLVSAQSHALENFLEFKKNLVVQSSDNFDDASEGNLTLERGTRAEILDDLHVHGSVFAFKLKIRGGPRDGDIVWVQDTPSNSNMSWFSNPPQSWETPPATGPKVKLTAPEDNTPRPKGPQEVDPTYQINVAANLTEAVKKMDPTPPKVEPDCPECGVPIDPAKFERCEGVSTGYMEPELSKMATEGKKLDANLVEGRIPITKVANAKCVQHYMTTRYGNFKHCAPGANAPSNMGSDRPCFSRRLFNLTYNSFELAGHCLKGFLPGTSTTSGYKDVMEAMLAKFGHESGFKLNNVGGGVDWGISQLNGSGTISDLTRIEIPSMKQFLNSQTDPMCKDIAKTLDQPMQRGGSCSAISLSEGNPMKNMLYGMAHYKNSRKFLDTQVFDSYELNKRYLSKMTNLSASDREKFEIEASTLAHNFGIGGAANAVKNALMSANANSSLKDLIGVLRGSSRRGNLGYLDKVANDLKAAEKGAGGKCIL